MKFRNIKTGAVIDAPSMLGGNWELVGGDKSPKKETVSVDIPAPVAEEVKPVKKTRKTATKKTK